MLYGVEAWQELIWHQLQTSSICAYHWGFWTFLWPIETFWIPVSWILQFARLCSAHVHVDVVVLLSMYICSRSYMYCTMRYIRICTCYIFARVSHKLSGTLVSSGPSLEEVVCVDCDNNTAGNRCQSCRAGYFRLPTDGSSRAGAGTSVVCTE